MQLPASMDSDSHTRIVVRMPFRSEVLGIAESPLVQIATLADEIENCDTLDLRTSDGGADNWA